MKSRLQKKVGGEGLVWKSIRSLPALEHERIKLQNLIKHSKCCLREELKKLLPSQHLLIVSSSEFEAVKDLAILEYGGTLIFCTGNGATDGELLDKSLRLPLNADTVSLHNHRRQRPHPLAETIKRMWDVWARIIKRLQIVASGGVVARLQSEFRDLQLLRNDNPGISASPEENNIFCWKATITCGEHTVFRGIEYALSLSFPADYPFKVPKVKFETACFHPNVDVNGNIGLDILQEDKWSPDYNVKKILLSIQSLLREPNTTSLLLNVQAAALWANQEEYKKMVDKALQVQ